MSASTRRRRGGKRGRAGRARRPIVGRQPHHPSHRAAPSVLETKRHRIDLRPGWRGYRVRTTAFSSGGPRVRSPIATYLSPRIRIASSIGRWGSRARLGSRDRTVTAGRNGVRENPHRARAPSVVSRLPVRGLGSLSILVLRRRSRGSSAVRRSFRAVLVRGREHFRRKQWPCAAVQRAGTSHVNVGRPGPEDRAGARTRRRSVGSMRQRYTRLSLSG